MNTTERRSSRRRPAFAGLLLAILLLAGAIGFATSRTASRALDHRGARPGLTPADSGLRYDVVPLGARDGTRLEGWWIPPTDSVRRRDLAVVVMAHGVDESGKAGMLRHAGYLHRAGYILLLFDFRSYGGSGGRRTTGGFLEQQDVDAALRLARERALGAPLVLFGEDMGATDALLVAAEDPGVACVVADSPLPTYEDALLAPLTTGADSSDVLARIAWRPGMRWLWRQAVGEAFAPADSVALKAAPLAGMRPVCVIHGQADDRVPLPARARLLRALGPANATWSWMAPGAGHAGAYTSDPWQYQERVLEFLDEALAEWARKRGGAGRATP
jgi:pimeloyl-ACP methyl ester carboxylesterase